VSRPKFPNGIHLYKPDPHSGAGNCACGAPERHWNHPHEAASSLMMPERCTCAQLLNAPIHQYGVQDAP
jgi:hypothetical protein